MESHSLISADIIASYAADAAREIDGVNRVVEGARPRHNGVRVTNDDGVVGLEIHLSVDWGAHLPTVGGAVQSRVADYVGRMTELQVANVDVVVDEIGPPPEGR